MFLACWGTDAIAIHTIEMEICTEAHSQTNPCISVAFIVWQDNRNGNWDIYAYDLDREMEYAICTADSNQTNPSIGCGSIFDDVIIVWQDDRNGNSDIYGYKISAGDYDLGRGSEIAVCTDPCEQRNPVSLGEYVCWQDNRSGNWDIYAKVYEQGEEPNEFVICEEDGDQVNPAVSFVTGAQFVWQDSRNGDWDIYGYTMEDQNEFAICVEEGNQVNPSTGFFAVWQDDRNGNNDIYASICGDILCSERSDVAVCIDSSDQEHPLFSENDFIVWQDNRRGSWDIYGYRVDSLFTGTTFVVAAADADQIGAAASGPWVVWQDNRNGNEDIYGAYICLRGNDNCDECAIELFDGQPYFGSTEGMRFTYWGGPPPLTSSCGFNDFIDVWHIYRPTMGGPVTITTADSSLDTVLSVYNSCYSSYPGSQEPIELACNDDYCLENAGSKVTLDVVKGKTYYIRVSGFNNQTGDYRIVVKRGAATQPIKSDLNGDGKVDWSDFSIFAAEWLLPDSQQ
jgi:beta propeller repeat protein